MQIYHSLIEWQQIRKKMPENLSIGYVPTMGNLHSGHLSLVSACKSANDFTIVSIFVNKPQFNKVDDFNSYPRTLDTDLKILEDAGVDCCIIPSDADVYHDGYHYQVQEIKRSLTLEGKFRPGHFTGVLTVLMKFFNLVKPHNVYMGEKDAQQLQLVRGMVKAFFMDIDVHACPTIRLPSGLAHSSRNNKLNKDELILANKFANIFHSSSSCEEAIEKISNLGIKIEYLEDSDNHRFAAVWIGEVRLIDNFKIR